MEEIEKRIEFLEEKIKELETKNNELSSKNEELLTSVEGYKSKVEKLEDDYKTSFNDEEDKNVKKGDEKVSKELFSIVYDGIVNLK